MRTGIAIVNLQEMRVIDDVLGAAHTDAGVFACIHVGNVMPDTYYVQQCRAQPPAMLLSVNFVDVTKPCSKVVSPCKQNIGRHGCWHHPIPAVTANDRTFPFGRQTPPPLSSPTSRATFRDEKLRQLRRS